MKHVFHVKGVPFYLTQTNLLMIVAILKLDPAQTNCNLLVLAIKALRETQKMGLYEAKQIVDFISAYGSLGRDGIVYINRPEVPITYSVEA